MARATTPKALLEHPTLDTMGMFFEAHGAIVEAASQQMEADHGISGQRFEVLLRLARTSGHRLRMTDLAAQTTLSASGLTRVVDRLVANGLVERTSCPSDRRGSFAALTPAGEALILAALPGHLDQLTDILEGALSPKEIETFGALIRRLRDHVHPDAARGAHLADCEGVRPG